MIPGLEGRTAVVGGSSSGLGYAVAELMARSGARVLVVSRSQERVGKAVEKIRAAGGRVRFLTDSVTGPAERESIARFLSRFENGRHVTYDPISFEQHRRALRQDGGDYAGSINTALRYGLQTALVPPVTAARP